MRRRAYGFEVLIWCVLNASLKVKTVLEDIANIKRSRNFFTNKAKEGKNDIFRLRNLTLTINRFCYTETTTVAKAKCHGFPSIESQVASS